MTPQTITLPLPQQGDRVEQLLARLGTRRIYGTALALAARNATTYSSDIVTAGFNRLFIYMNTTVAGGGTGIRPIVRFKNEVSGQYHTLTEASTFLTGTGWFNYCVGPNNFSTHFNMGTGSGIQGYANLQLPGVLSVGLAFGSVNTYTTELHYELLS
jgi:hypothetical protein